MKGENWIVPLYPVNIAFHGRQFYNGGKCGSCLCSSHDHTGPSTQPKTSARNPMPEGWGGVALPLHAWGRGPCAASMMKLGGNR